MVSQVSTPSHSFLSGQLSGDFVHENLQKLSHPVPGPLPAPKSQSSPISITPFPQTAPAPRQAPFVQVRPTSHSEPSCAGSGASPQVLFAVQTALLHGIGAGQSAAGSTHDGTQPGSHPSPGTMLPSSQASPASTTPLPHEARTQKAFLQVPPGQLAPSGRGFSVLHV